ncbi:Miz sp-ring zinc finger [Pleurostoma richardsiae]|uniref:Miz sp-ring zinc finger n=1 Tax=Pleurostoma richardsiae TaxID=41990 RepID=A0AA38RB04_9PEZI|nr:Miz sp-ring zinc finger [Pleurostoma richardsiae]
MASSAPSIISRPEVQSLVKFVQSQALLNRNLSTICQVNGLKTTGVKAELQRRIVDFINKTVETNNIQRFQEIQKSIYAFKNGTANQPMLHGQPFPYSSPRSASYTSHISNGMASSYQGYGLGGANGQKSQPHLGHTFTFKSSPFYEIKYRVGDVKLLEVMTQHRNSVSIQIRAQDHPILSQCLTDPSMRVLAFCAAGNTGFQDIAFPHQAELKVNSGEVKANLRGLKNKPGSTRPVDITDQLRLRQSNYLNNVELVYALTQKRFYFTVYLCRTTPIEILASRVKNGKKIPKASVILEMTKKAKDSEIEMSSQVLSLKCPLSYMRLDVPCRSTNCSHIQCFDVTSYLQLQEQGPQWLCPVCNRAAPFDQLAVDEYVKDILERTPKSVEQVTIEPNGEWKIQHDEEDQRPAPTTHNASFVDDDDDDLIISETSFLGRGTSTPNRSLPFSTGTPTTTGASRESSTMAPRSSHKRPIAEVVDLTLSDDDEPSRPPPKKQYTSSNGYSLSPF